MIAALIALLLGLVGFVLGFGAGFMLAVLGTAKAATTGELQRVLSATGHPAGGPRD